MRYKMSSRRSVHSNSGNDNLFNRMQDVEDLDLDTPRARTEVAGSPRASSNSKIDDDSDSFYSVSDEYGDKYEDGTKSKESIFSPIYIFFVIIIIIGIVINLILLSRLQLIDRNGNPVSEDRKTMATVNGIGFAILLIIILVGGFYMLRHHGAIKNIALSLFVAIFITFIIIFMMGLLMGEYMDVGHLWAPIQPIIPDDR